MCPVEPDVVEGHSLFAYEQFSTGVCRVTGDHRHRRRVPLHHRHETPA
ncbi:hypothetical protein QP028_05110 [Corynebacterium suedekumii]|nr:hypothetical protein QP028_05110 [Corynebacterium suedekumii]